MLREFTDIMFEAQAYFDKAVEGHEKSRFTRAYRKQTFATLEHVARLTEVAFGKA